MKYFKIFLAVIFTVGLLGGGAYVVSNADQMQFESVCKKDNKRYTSKYCSNVGKYAWTQQSVLNINEKNYGKIIGVAWRKKDSVISSRNQKEKRRSEKNAYYYIVGYNKDAGSQFLMLAEQIDARDSKTETKK
ncbi:MAG: hypothetical protein COV35_10465 [Alphaproteobacteria bacterium CG11_big_fil_rev_8_21_14_0_20_39_49]|nr:MAG: hypothetical protein COV35_10465 [Alphaproteobacteria bacterium CG11_big_fil_rev_8_21_14_0_20_39_49]